jgi:hypothetical protein
VSHEAPRIAPEDLRSAFPRLDDDQRADVLELFDLLFGEDLRTSGPNPESFVRTEAVLRAVADLLRGMVDASRMGAPS